MPSSAPRHAARQVNRHGICRIEIPNDYIPTYELGLLFGLIIFISHIQAIISVLSGYIAIFVAVLFIFYGDRRRRNESESSRNRAKALERSNQNRHVCAQSNRVQSWVEEQAAQEPAWISSPRSEIRRAHQAARVASQIARGDNKTDHSEAMRKPPVQDISNEKLHTAQDGRRRSLSAPISPSNFSTPSPHSRESTFVASTPTPKFAARPAKARLAPFKVWRDASPTPSIEATHSSPDSNVLGSPNSDVSSLASSNGFEASGSVTLSPPCIKAPRVRFSKAPLSSLSCNGKKKRQEAWSVVGDPLKFKLQGPTLLEKNPDRWEWKDKHQDEIVRHRLFKGYRRPTT